MTLEELKADLLAVLRVEEQLEVDWQQVEALCLSTIGRLNTEPNPSYPYDIVYHFLDDPDIRQEDADYGEMQRIRLKEWLATN